VTRGGEIKEGGEKYGRHGAACKKKNTRNGKQVNSVRAKNYKKRGKL
jgi:hypothetical protein